MAEQPTVKEILKAIGVLIFLSYAGYKAYAYYSTGNDTPIDPMHMPKDSILNPRDIKSAIDAAQDNEPRFDTQFKNRNIIGTGDFISADKDFGSYNIRVTTRYGTVTCHTSNELFLNFVATLKPNARIVIYGIIDDTWMGELQLKQCGIGQWSGAEPNFDE